MKLFVNELGHLSAYFISVLIVRVFKKDYVNHTSVFAGLFSAFFIDFDHLVDYFLHFGLTFNLYDFLHGGYFNETERVIVPLHSWELAGVFGLIWLLLKDKKKYSWVLMVFIGFVAHLIFDIYSNGFSWDSYFLVNRIMHNFSRTIFM